MLISFGIFGPPSNTLHGFLGPHESAPNGISIGSAVIAGLTVCLTNAQGSPRYNVYIVTGLACRTAMRAKNKAPFLVTTNDIYDVVWNHGIPLATSSSDVFSVLLADRQTDGQIQDDSKYRIIACAVKTEDHVPCV